MKTLLKNGMHGDRIFLFYLTHHDKEFRTSSKEIRRQDFGFD